MNDVERSILFFDKHPMKCTFPKQPSCFFRCYGLQAPSDDMFADYCGWRKSRQLLLKVISINDKSG